MRSTAPASFAWPGTWSSPPFPLPSFPLVLCHAVFHAVMLSCIILTCAMTLTFCGFFPYLNSYAEMY
jgi:hypothetical protein